MQPFFFTNSPPRRPEPQPRRRADAGAHGPLPCLAGWLSLMSQCPLLGTSVINRCSLRSLPGRPGCHWCPEGVAAAVRTSPHPFGAWACGQKVNAEPSPFSGPPALLVGCPRAEHHTPRCLSPCPPKQPCVGRVTRRQACCPGTGNTLAPGVVSVSTRRSLPLGAGRSLHCYV